jgi:hypothetical protein
MLNSFDTPYSGSWLCAAPQALSSQRVLLSRRSRLEADWLPLSELQQRVLALFPLKRLNSVQLAASLNDTPTLEDGDVRRVIYKASVFPFARIDQAPTSVAVRYQKVLHGSIKRRSPCCQSCVVLVPLHTHLQITRSPEAEILLLKGVTARQTKFWSSSICSITG